MPAAEQSCWICGCVRTCVWKERTLHRRLTAEDLRVTDARYGVTLALRRCAECSFVFADDPDLSNLPQLYEEMHDDEYVKSGKARALQMRRLLRRLLTLSPNARSLLDVGAGTGLLVAEAHRAGLDACGVEPSHALAERSNVPNGATLLQGMFPHPKLTGQRFDIIALVDVIEHVADPLALLRHCRDSLTDAGILAVITPDLNSAVRRVFRSRWWHFRVAHVGYFDRATLELAACRSSLVPISWWRPTWFLPLNYLASRVGRYLPIKRANQLARRARLRDDLRWTIPINLRDSLAVALVHPPHHNGHVS